MKKNRLSAAAVFTLFGLGLLFTTAEVSAAPGGTEPQRPLPDFNAGQGWLGADDAYSISLGKDRSLWLFGDTFVGDRDATVRNQFKVMVRNSVGISVCHAGSACTIRYFWRNPYTPQARSFFDTGTEALWYWPMDGLLNHGKLFVPLLAVRSKPHASPTDAFGFEIAGTKLAVISNLKGSPEKWRISIKDLSDDRFWPGTSLVRDDKYVLWYTYVSNREGKPYMTVLRVPKNKMAMPASAWQYLKSDGSWGSGLPGSDALHVIDWGVAEMSVRYHPPIKKWVAILPGPGFPTTQIFARIADSPAGPWSSPQTIYEFPEMKRGTPGYDKDTFCYATKEHIEFTDTKIALTYACNSMVFSKTVGNMEIYRPRVVVLELPH
jgi:hypothetical protein